MSILEEPNAMPRAAVGHVATSADIIEQLRRVVDGAVLVPGDGDYEQRRLAWNRRLSHRPVAIVVAADAADVTAVVRTASQHGIGVGVQATGHGAVVPVDGILVDTTALDEIAVDPERRTARIGAGCSWGPVLHATQAHGLAPLLGSSSTVGAVGYTLGGGLGWLARRFGPSCDAVRSFELVAPDGQRLHVDRDTDLFRALRGGGGGALGIVTSMEVDLYPIETVYAGNLLYPSEMAAEVAERYATWVATAPNDLTSSIVFMNFPPVPEVPEPLRGRSFTIVRGCWCGDLDEGRQLIDQWRRIMPPIVDMWDAMPFAEQAAISQDPVDPLPAVTTGGWLSRFDRAIAEQLAAATFPSDGPPLLLFTEVRHLGGAVRTNDRTSSVMGHRDRDFLVHLVGVPMMVDAPAIDAHQQQALAGLGDSVVVGRYMNFMEHGERRARSAEAVSMADRATLADLQRRHDPAGTFRYGVDHTAAV